MKHLLNRNKFINEELTVETKVVDSFGKPLNMYHGGSYTGGEFKGIAWFTSSKGDAKYYAKQNGGIVTKAYIIIRNPLYTGDVSNMNIKLTDDINRSIKNRNLTGVKVDKNGYIEFIEANDGVLIAQDIGSDGIIDLHNGEILDCVVFKNDQIVVK